MKTQNKIASLVMSSALLVSTPQDSVQGVEPSTSSNSEGWDVLTLVLEVSMETIRLRLAQRTPLLPASYLKMAQFSHMAHLSISMQLLRYLIQSQKTLILMAGESLSLTESTLKNPKIK
jgi:hypothetical protein